MPSSFKIFPPLGEAEQRIVNEYGGWVGFMRAIQLSPMVEADTQKALSTIHNWAYGYKRLSPEFNIPTNVAYENNDMDVPMADATVSESKDEEKTQQQGDTKQQEETQQEEEKQA